MELFVTDLDGTLLNSHKEVSIKSIEILLYNTSCHYQPHGKRNGWRTKILFLVTCFRPYPTCTVIEVQTLPFLPGKRRFHEKINRIS